MPEFRAARCTRYRYRYSECQRCLEVCPHNAIELHDSGATLRADACRDCGLCTSACRTQAWVHPDWNPITLLREIIRHPGYRIACAPCGAKAQAQVPCLGALDGVWLAYLAKRGIAIELHGAWHCEHCEHGARGAERLELNREAMNALHQAAQGAVPDAAAWVLPRYAPAPSGLRLRTRPAPRPHSEAGRRNWLQRWLRRPQPEKATPAASPIEDKAIRAGAWAVSEMRELLTIVTRQDAPFELPLHEGLPAHALTLHSGCTVCEACFRVCPSGALQIDENPLDWGLSFQADLCMACEVCLEVCQPRVLDVQTSFDARPDQNATRLLALGKQRCARCDRFFASNAPATTCPVCRDDEDAFTALFGD